jgi:hypothetical protein
MPLAIRSFFWIWLILALAAGRCGFLAHLPPAAFPGLIVALTALLLAAGAWVAPFRAWVAGITLRALVLFHVTRFVGFYFLHLYLQGALPYDFAVPGGLGDILVALFAIVAAMVPVAPARWLRLISIWNVFGFVELGFVVLTAARLGRADPASMRALTHLPLSLLPTFLVPLLFTSHLVLFFRLRRATPAADGTPAPGR